MRRCSRLIACTRRSEGTAADDIAKERVPDRTACRAEAQRIREFLATHTERRSEKGAIRKSNVTDNDSAKMATSKGVIQGYTAVAAVDSKAQIIVAAQAHGSGSEQSVLLPDSGANTRGLRTDQTVVTADAGYHSEANLKGLYELGVPALIADGLMRRRDERFAGQGEVQGPARPALGQDGRPQRHRRSKFKPDGLRLRRGDEHLHLSGGKEALLHRQPLHDKRQAAPQVPGCEARLRALSI